jgi:hypothetical protein
MRWCGWWAASGTTCSPIISRQVWRRQGWMSAAFVRYETNPRASLLSTLMPVVRIRSSWHREPTTPFAQATSKVPGAASGMRAMRSFNSRRRSILWMQPCEWRSRKAQRPSLILPRRNTCRRIFCARSISSPRTRAKPAIFSDAHRPACRWRRRPGSFGNCSIEARQQSF